MRVFIAGSTGAIGQPLVKQLVASGHQVFGLTHSREKFHLLESLGAIPVMADVLDEAAVLQEVKNAQPEAIVDMLTSLPKVYTPEAMRQASEHDARVRLEGGSNLQKGALAAGTKRYILQSSAFWYAPGPGLATEKDSFAFDAPPAISTGTKVYNEIEQRVLQNPNLEGVALRFGFFYGPGTWFAHDENVAHQVRHQQFYIVGDGRGIWNFIHIEDAAKSIVAALNCSPGIYNITNDTPIELSQWLPAYARWLGAPPPPTRPIEEEERINGPNTVYYATKLRGASNAKAKREMGFHPRPLEWLMDL